VEEVRTYARLTMWGGDSDGSKTRKDIYLTFNLT
jgi:hypothetical protein